MVLIEDELPRGNWRLGRIQELVLSEDGEIRSAKVLLPTNKLIGRPLNLLYPIECPANDTTTDEDNSDRWRDIPNDGTQYSQQNEPRPKRQAATRARDRIKKSSKWHLIPWRECHGFSVILLFYYANCCYVHIFRHFKYCFSNLIQHTDMSIWIVMISII